MSREFDHGFLLDQVTIWKYLTVGGHHRVTNLAWERQRIQAGNVERSPQPNLNNKDLLCGL